MSAAVTEGGGGSAGSAGRSLARRSEGGGGSVALGTKLGRSRGQASPGPGCSAAHCVEETAAAGEDRSAPADADPAAVAGAVAARGHEASHRRELPARQTVVLRALLLCANCATVLRIQADARAGAAEPATRAAVARGRGRGERLAGWPTGCAAVRDEGRRVSPAFIAFWSTSRACSHGRRTYMLFGT